MTKNNLEFSKNKVKLSTVGRTGAIDYFKIILFFNTLSVVALLVAGYYMREEDISIKLFNVAIALATCITVSCLFLLGLIMLGDTTALKSEEHVECMLREQSDAK